MKKGVLGIKFEYLIAIILAVIIISIYILLFSPVKIISGLNKTLSNASSLIP